MGADKNSLQPGFVMRAANMDDLESVVVMFNQYSRHYMGIDEIISADFIGNEWTSPRFNTQTDIRLVFAPQGRLVGYIEVWTTGQPPVHPWLWMRRILPAPCAYTKKPACTYTSSSTCTKRSSELGRRSAQYG